MCTFKAFCTPRARAQEEDFIADFRLNFEMYFGALTLLVLSPYVIIHLWQKHFTMAAATIFIVLLSSCNSLSIYRRGIQTLPLTYFFLLLLSTLVAGLFTQGPNVIFWCYPFAFIILSIVDHRQARMMLGFSLLVFIPAAFYALETSIAASFLASYLLVCLFGDIVVNLVDQSQKQQAHLATTDPLTGAYNRRTFLPRLDEAAESCRRGIGTASLIAIDIDYFKKINDSLGHLTGDEALKGLVHTLLGRKRKLDTIFRTGGEEFFVLAHNIEPGESLAFADGLRMTVQEADILPGQRITISIGVASYREGQSVDAWIHQADTNLYEAKRRGRNRVWPPYVKEPSEPPAKLVQSVTG
ncbi:hypothetical protein A9Q90_01905 [Gammaproteobacteria bacterium 54_18_T64]|nr:hypothetical protein A9Q90_01905 [Gammaproteobacteria bacterium 54_18_T64]